MKTILILVSLSSILSVFSAPTPDPVIDVLYHKTVRSDRNYYLLSANDTITAIGTQLVPGQNGRCPVYVAQWEGFLGQQLTLTPVNPKKGVVRESTDINIKFTTGFQTCAKSAVWRIVYDKLTREYVVAVGGAEGNPGRDTVDNWFKIEKYNGSYKLVFCPSVCKECKDVVCKDVGISVDKQGNRRLALSNVPYALNFWEAR